MHCYPLILLALGSLALAIPTNDTVDAFRIEKRSSRPWLDTFELDDVTCKNRDVGSDDDQNTFIEASKCQAFQPEIGRVGGSWGAGTYSISSFWAFENEDCTGKVKAKITRKKNEDGFCFKLATLGCVDGEDLDNPCFWNSVRGNW